MSTETDIPTERIHGWFGLTYSNYLVLPRTLLQSMPDSWQDQFVTLLEELDDAYAHIEHATYHVQAGTWAYPDDIDPDELKALGYRRPVAPDGVDEDADLPDVWYGPDGEEHDGHMASVFVPGKDPVPHYNRGRTRVAPAPDVEQR